MRIKNNGNKIKHYSIYLFSLFFTLIILHSAAFSQNKIKKLGKFSQKRYNNSPLNSFFPIMAWDDVHDEATIKKMAECGINLIAFVPPGLLDVCEKYKVKAILFDPRMTPEWDKSFNSEKANKVLPMLIKKYNRNPALFGYYLKDEPGGDQFSELAKSAGLIRKLAPGKWAYVNLPPGMGDWYDTAYLQNFVDLLHPPVISYDNYPVGKTAFSWGFWANLSDVRSASIRNGVPFMVIVLSSAHLTYPIPTAADLRLEVYGALAYGARGIAYYKFVSEPLSVLGAPDLGNFRGGPLDQFHYKTPTYGKLRTINRCIANLSPVLLKLHSDEVYFIGDVPERNRGINKESLITGMKSGSEFIIGDFTHKDGSRWVMIVNKNLESSVPCIPQFRDSALISSVEYLNPTTGKLALFPNPWYYLAPGQGVLLRLNMKNEK